MDIPIYIQGPRLSRSALWKVNFILPSEYLDVLEAVNFCVLTSIFIFHMETCSWLKRCNNIHRDALSMSTQIRDVVKRLPQLKKPSSQRPLKGHAPVQQAEQNDQKLTEQRRSSTATLDVRAVSDISTQQETGDGTAQHVSLLDDL